MMTLLVWVKNCFGPTRVEKKIDHVVDELVKISDQQHDAERRIKKIEDMVRDIRQPTEAEWRMRA